jgi:hypothetical protein
MDAIQALKESWASGEEENYPESKRVPASDLELSAFEAAHVVVLPEQCKEFYRRVNGMTIAQWARDDNHFLVKFFSLRDVFPITAQNEPSSEDDGRRFFAIAAAGHHPSDHCEPYFGVELFASVAAGNPVRMFWNGKSFPVAASFLEFVAAAATTTLEKFQLLDPDFARLRREQGQSAADSYNAWVRRKRWWQFWKRA